jgi:hypothetical protein
MDPGAMATLAAYDHTVRHFEVLEDLWLPRPPPEDRI